MTSFQYRQAPIEAAFHMLKEHAEYLSSPWDSYIEENLFKNHTYLLYDAELAIGYASVSERQLFSFYVSKPYYRRAPEILEYFIKELYLETALVLTNDPLFVGLIMEWNCRFQAPLACFFTDTGRIEKPLLSADNPVFREAQISDMDAIILHTGDFFDHLEERIAQQTIFLLEDDSTLLGCGIVERGRFSQDYVSIGMITCKQHRKKGVAQTILWHLKEWAYAHGLHPVAGCWYYNVLSRKSLEASGMIPTGKGFIVTLKEKPRLPLRTGNPPGELVE